MTRDIPNEARTLQINLRESLGLDEFLRTIWAARDPNAGAKPAGEWPIVRACDRKTEAVVDIARLPAKLRVAP